MAEKEQDALRVWMDFWELTGARRIDILRGEKTRYAAPAILLEDATGNVLDRSTDLDFSKIKLEAIGVSEKDDTIRFNGKVYAVKEVVERDVGSFSIWTISAQETDGD